MSRLKGWNFCFLYAFDYWPGVWLYGLKGIRNFPQPRQTNICLAPCLNSDHERFLPHPCRFICHSEPSIRRTERTQSVAAVRLEHCIPEVLPFLNNVFPFLVVASSWKGTRVMKTWQNLMLVSGFLSHWNATQGKVTCGTDSRFNNRFILFTGDKINGSVLTFVFYLMLCSDINLYYWKRT